MLFIPLPFVVAALLFLLLARLFHENGATKNAAYFYVLIGGYALLSVIIGLRWGYGMRELLPLMSILAASLPPLAWVAYSSLTAQPPTFTEKAIYTLPLILVALLLRTLPDAIDAVVGITGIIFAGLMLNLVRQGSDVLIRTSLSQAVVAHRALIANAIMLILSAMVDGFMTIDFMLYRGAHAANVVSFANLVSILILGTAAAVASHSQPISENEDSEIIVSPQASDEDVGLVARIDKFIAEHKLFRDPDLTLNRLSRKMTVPARRISTAVNRVRNESVSVYMNRHRVAEACRLLKETDRSITAIMFDSGFQTKSNFNDAFKKITGTNPASWRSTNIHLDMKV
jgi:AraC-like DNA-binding protein